MADHVLLCLKCRCNGHDVDHCPSEVWQDELAWTFSPARKSTEWIAASVEDSQDICARCKSLDLLRVFESYPPWRSQSELSKAFEEAGESILNIGSTGSVQFWADCSVCCCLFGITPNPRSSKQEILLVPDWSVCRVAGELGIKMDMPEKRHYATCLLSVLNPSSISLPIPVVAHRTDALCIVENDIGLRRTLGARRVDSHQLDVTMINKWIRACMSNHDAACTPMPTKDLEEVRLIDVESRQVVAYPGPKSEYIALSYVWGNVRQESYKLGDSLVQLPQTLEDAISLTRKLGKRYIWIDSVCIDQSDEKDKATQIQRMWSIYRGSYVTIIALSGRSANSGLSRLSRSAHCPQLSCNINGKTILSLMLTLSQQIWTCPWGKRAWTLQEGLLSPRCLYISDEQAYFDCSSMQSCESLDESRSWCHRLSPSSNPTQEGFVTWMLRQAGSGALRIPLDWPSRRLEHWGEKLNLYSYRDMTYDEDALRAFAGVLQRLETIYSKGFVVGLPVEDFDWALLWRSQVPPLRRPGFPSWSWAG
jgi:Heterokaryon incompatibility protein (HET)